jgi:tripartite-type tricarboxylate transporter receptor subunit TctC
VVVTNIDGAGGAVGTAQAAKATPDGYTLVVGSDGTLTVGPQARNTGYTADNFVPIGLMATVPSGFIVRTDSPFKSLGELVAYLKANPRTKYTSVGTGSGVHLEASLWADLAGVDIVHIGNRGGKNAIVKLLSGEVTFIVVAATNLPAQIKEGSDLRPLAVTSGEPWEFAPSIPTLKSLGYDLETYTWWGLFAPKGTPEDVLKKLRAALHATLTDPEMVAMLKKLYYTPALASPAEINKMIEVDLVDSRRALEMLGMLKK